MYSAHTLLLGLLAFCIGVSVNSVNAASRRRKHDMTKIRTHPTEHWFLDPYDRVRIFHGFNSVKKGDPWYHDYLLNNTRLDDMERFGLNIIRLGTMWSGMEPVEGQYNETYRDIMRDIIDRLGERGVYAMLDMHQDCLTSYATYDGVPQWLVDAFPEPTNPHPWPFDSISQWAQNYLTQAVSEHFQCVYNNTYDALDRWADFWKYTASQYGTIPSVLGYDYMNEPWVGDFFTDPELLLPGTAARQNLQPSYEVIAEKVHQVDTQSIQFYEPITYGTFLDRPFVGSGFNRVPGGRQYRNISAFSWHAYCFNLDILPPNTPDENRTAAVEWCSEVLLPQFFNTTFQTLEKTGGAAILSEFGLCKTGTGDAINIRCERFLELADDYLHSWTEWDHNDNKWYNPDGSWQWEKIEPHVRTYAQATAGIPTYMNFDNDDLEFDFEFTVNPAIQQPTDIFVPSLRYTNDYTVETSEGLSYETDGDHLLVYYTGEGNDLDAYVHISAL